MKILLPLGFVAIAAVGGSLIHPFGKTAVAGTGQTIFREAQIDPPTLVIVRRACQNCDSENTEWPWYGHVAPVSWLLARDVQQARSHMNLSQWRHYSTDDRLRLLSAIGSVARNRTMPPTRYLLVHREARLSDQEREQIYRWTRNERRRISAGQAQTDSLKSE
jgi:Haem-binding domain